MGEERRRKGTLWEKRRRRTVVEVEPQDSVLSRTVLPSLDYSDHSLPGEPRIPPSSYHCSQCNKGVLTQDIVWVPKEQPRCPECSAILESPPEDRLDLLNQYAAAKRGRRLE